MQSKFTGTSPLDDFQHSKKGLETLLELLPPHGIEASIENNNYVYLKPLNSNQWKDKYNAGNICIAKGTLIINFEHPILKKGMAYTLGRTYALLEWEGNMTKATIELRKMGFGTQ